MYNYVAGNAKFRGALNLIINHPAHLKLRYAQNTRKRDIENLFTEMKYNFLQSVPGCDAISLVGPALYEHFTNYKYIGVNKVIIPEINTPTRAIMLKDPVYWKNKNLIEIVNDEFFDLTIERLKYKLNTFCDIDYDGTAKYKSVKTALIQFISSLHAERSQLPDRFAFVQTFCRRSENQTKLYKDYNNHIYHFINSFSGFSIEEGHYVDYSGFGNMTTVILLINKRNLFSRLKSKTTPVLNYYTYLKDKSLAQIKGELVRNSKYI